MRITRRQAVAAAGAALVPERLAAGAPRPGGTHGEVDVVVVGAGAFGAWTAWHLARSGRSVRLLDAYAPGNARSSSGGESRVIRLSYGGDPLYSDMARHSLAAWAELSQRQTLPLLHRTGVLWFSPAADPYMARSIAWLQANGIAHRAGDTGWLRRTFPQIAFAEGESGFIEEASGALIAGRGVQSVVADAAVPVLRIAASRPERLADGRVRVGGITAGAAIYACGPWLPGLFAEELAGRIVVTRQEVYHFGPAAGDGRFAPPALPVWADFNAGDIVYGFPGLEGQGFKMAFDRHGPPADPDRQDRRVTDAGVAEARAYLARRFPALADAPYVHGRVCQYENTSNGDFLIDRLPGFANVWLVGGGSGHGFKHGPAVGRLVARHLADATLAVEPRFALASKAAVQARTVY